MRAFLLCFMGSLLLTLCGCGGPRVEATPRAKAMADAQPREMRVVKVWDKVNDAMNLDHDENVSHYIEVDVLSGPDQGKQMTLPYDEWNVGKRPPAVGERIVAAPADWVHRSPQTAGRPYGGW